MRGACPRVSYHGSTALRAGSHEGGNAIDSSIDLLYAVLYGIVTRAPATSGLDPYLGLMHDAKSGRLSLTYDVSEIYKPLVVHSVIQSSRSARLSTLRGSRMLTPRTIEVPMKGFYGRLSREGEKHYNRRSIWILPIREAARFKDSLSKRFRYEAYVYDPTSGL